MAKGKGEVQGWITRNGVHVPIYENYTVRGGAEPKSKGSKFKSAGRKKKKVDTSTTSGKTANDLNSNLKKKGLELDSADLSSMAHKDFNDEKVTMYDKDGNTYEGTYNKYKNGDREIVDIKKTGGRDTGKSEASKGHIEEGKGAVKDVEGKKPEMHDWKQDRTDTQEERDAFAKEHEQGIKDRLAKINEQNKPKAKEETFKGSVLKKSDEKGEGYDWKKDRIDEPAENAAAGKTAQNGAPRVTDEEARSNKAATPTSGNFERKKYKVDGNVMKGLKSAKEMTGRSDLTVHELSNDAISTHYAFRDKNGNEIGQFHESHTNKKANYMNLNTSATGDNSKPIKGGVPTTVSGLRSAYAEATGSERSKIAAALRAKGYRFTGGKWVKG